MIFFLNDRIVTTDEPAGKVLLDFVRRDARHTGAKEGCKEGECGACTVLLGQLEEGGLVYRNAASCLVPLGDAAGRHAVTIEGLNKPDGTLNPIQQAFVDAGATQCGFCTPGFILSLTAFFLNSPKLLFEDALDAVDGNLCRCTGHVAIREAITRLCDEFGARLDPKKDRVGQLISWGILQPWMADMQMRLAELEKKHPAGAQSGAEAGAAVFVGGSGKDVISTSHSGKDAAVFVGGGTDAFVQRPEALRHARLSFLSRRPELSFITEEGDSVAIGGGTTVEKMRQSELLARVLPGNKHTMTLISSTIMRNRATAAGNLVNASPIADLAILFLALGAALDLEASDGAKRGVALADFYKGYKKLDLGEGELVRTIRFKKPGGSAKFSFEKVSQREYLDIASVNTALLLTVEGKTITGAALSAGGIAPVPKLLTETARALTGKPLEAATVRAAVTVMDGEIAPIDDVRGSAGYKRRLLSQLVFAHFMKLFPNEFTLENLL